MKEKGHKLSLEMGLFVLVAVLFCWTAVVVVDGGMKYKVIVTSMLVQNKIIKWFAVCTCLQWAFRPRRITVQLASVANETQVLFTWFPAFDDEFKPSLYTCGGKKWSYSIFPVISVVFVVKRRQENLFCREGCWPLLFLSNGAGKIKLHCIWNDGIHTNIKPNGISFPFRGRFVGIEDTCCSGEIHLIMSR